MDVCDVPKLFPQASEKALECFARLNPHWRGAGWDDVLDLLINSDAHLDLTETMSPESALLALTLLYAKEKTDDGGT